MTLAAGELRIGEPSPGRLGSNATVDFGRRITTLGVDHRGRTPADAPVVVERIATQATFSAVRRDTLRTPHRGTQGLLPIEVAFAVQSGSRGRPQRDGRNFDANRLGACSCKAAAFEEVFAPGSDRFVATPPGSPRRYPTRTRRPRCMVWSDLVSRSLQFVLREPASTGEPCTPRLVSKVLLGSGNGRRGDA